MDATPSAASASGLPGKDCGQCGFRTCADLAEFAAHHPGALDRCVFRHPGEVPRDAMTLSEDEISWKDALGRPYDFVLEPIAGDPGPRETILPFKPTSVEALDLKTGSILYGRPVAVGCPVVHVGVIMEEPCRLDGTLVWCIVGPLPARQGGVEIGSYHVIAYEGIVRFTRKELEIGRRYFFLPRYCVLQSRHSGVISAATRGPAGVRVRLEGILIA